MNARFPHWRWLLPVLLVLLVAAFFAVKLEPDSHIGPPALVPTKRAFTLHRDALVIDLHTDSLLWPRDLNQRGDQGHLDFPRMREGGLDAVVLTHATRFFGVAGLKALHDRWPPATWWSSWARLRFQQRRLVELLEAAGGSVELARGTAALRENQRRGVLSILRGIEGAHGLGKDVFRVGEVAARGVVFIAPVHLSDNEYGGSSSGTNRGLTPLGKKLIETMNRERVLVDLAHASPGTFAEAAALTTLPPIVSHTGVRAIHDSWRNLTDAQIRAIADREGVIGLMLGPPALAAPDLMEAFTHLRHLVDVGGEDVAALGSDFDGYIDTPIDVTGLPQLTELMLRAGWTESRIRKILGENVLRVLETRERPSGS